MLEVHKLEVHFVNVAKESLIAQKSNNKATI